MPAIDSLVFVNNKGGSGKTFTLFQLSNQIAKSHPDCNILVVDFSVHSDTSAMLMGGLEAKNLMAASAGMTNTMNNTTADTRAEALIRDLVSTMNVDKAPSTGVIGNIFGSWFGADREGPALPETLDLQKYTVHPHDVNKKIPDNVYLIASARGVSWGANTEQHAGGAQEAPLWERRGDEWWPAAQGLRRALDALPGKWIVLFDTDHTAASPLTKIPLAVAAGSVIPLSLDYGDFERLYSDAQGHGLFSDVMIPMEEAGRLGGPVRKFIFTKMASQANDPVETPGGIISPFKPSKVAMEAMDKLVEKTRECFIAAPTLKRVICGSPEFGEDITENLASFAAAKFSAFKTVADAPLNASKLNGAPLVTMSPRDKIAKDANLTSATLVSLQTEIEFIASSLNIIATSD